MPETLLSLRSITKSFAGVHALKGVSFDLRPGEVHALVGENGAGKSTLIKVITGAERPDAGTLTIGGRGIAHMDPAGRAPLGIAAIYQQPALFPDLTVAREHRALARGPPRVAARALARSRRRARASCSARRRLDRSRSGWSSTLTMPEQQLVEIAKAIGADARILILDEPTASLTEREVERLFDVVSRLRAQGVGIIYISHRLEEIVHDRRSRDRAARRQVDRHARPRGRSIATELIRLMVGREMSAMFPKRPVPPAKSSSKSAT